MGDRDDVQVGRILDRREVLVLLGAGATFLAGCSDRRGGPAGSATPSAASPSSTGAPASEAGVEGVPECVVRPEQTEGPYFVDEKLNRSDIRSDPADGSVKEGAPLRLSFRVATLSSNGCAPLAGATVDVWHCDALGVYSDVRDPGFDTTGKKFLRGHQTTDTSGLASFTTIYPGWYHGRAVHVHFKIRSAEGGRTSEFTSQLYFDDALTDRVHASPPYSARGVRMRNHGDRIFRESGDKLMLDVKRDDEVYVAAFDIGLQS